MNAKEAIAAAQLEVRTRPLVAIDRLVEGCIADKALTLNRVLPILSEAITRSRQTQGGANEVQSVNIFAHDIGPTEKRLAALSLLRIATANPSFWDDEDFRIKMLRLCDDAFGKDLYPALKLDAKAQNFEKQHALERITSQVESDLAETIATWTTLAAIANFRQHFMAKFNFHATKCLIWPFLPRQLQSQRLDELFLSVNEYLTQDGQRILHAFNRLEEHLHVFKLEAQQFGTAYSLRFFSEIVDKIGVLAKEHIAQSPISKPAELVVEKPGKKYPLHTSGLKTKITFVIRNLGPGHAFDVCFRVLELTNIHISNSETYLGSLDPTFVTVDVTGEIESATQWAILIRHIIVVTSAATLICLAHAKERCSQVITFPA